MERLDKLIDLFKSSDNIYVLKELELLKIEIKTLVADSKIEALKELKNNLIQNKILCGD